MALSKTILYKGSSYKIPDLAKELGRSVAGLRYRLSKGLPLTPSKRKKTFITYEIKLKALDEWAIKHLWGTNHPDEHTLLSNYVVIRRWLVQKASCHQK